METETTSMDSNGMELVPEKRPRLPRWLVLAGVVAIALYFYRRRRSLAERTDPVGADPGENRA